MKKQYWITVKKGSYDKHKVIVLTKTPNQKDYPELEYMIGPYNDKSLAEKEARSHKNITGTFTDPFCNNGQGR